MKRTRVRYGRVTALALAVFLAVPATNAVLSASAEARPRHEIHLTVTVRPGDTLWDIAGLYLPDVDPRQAVDGIASLNGIDAGYVLPGQKLLIPA